MSWRFLFTKWRAPPHPGGTVAGPVYHHANTNMFSYLWNGRRIISASFGYPIYIGGVGISNYGPSNLISYNGYTGFSSGNWAVWYDYAYGWCAVNVSFQPTDKNPAYPVEEYWVPTDPWTSFTVGSYKGATFYTLKVGNAPGQFPAQGSSGYIYKRGDQRGTVYNGVIQTYQLDTDWAYWQSPSLLQPYGLFTPQGSATGNKYFGTPRWKNGTDLYVRSVNASGSPARYTYGAVVWDAVASKYILGTYGLATGWWENADPPTSGADWVLSFAKPEGSEEPDQPDVTLAWDKYILGVEGVAAYGIRASEWVD